MTISKNYTKFFLLFLKNKRIYLTQTLVMSTTETTKNNKELKITIKSFNIVG